MGDNLTILTRDYLVSKYFGPNIRHLAAMAQLRGKNQDEAYPPDSNSKPDAVPGMGDVALTVREGIDGSRKFSTYSNRNTTAWGDLEHDLEQVQNPSQCRTASGCSTPRSVEPLLVDAVCSDRSPHLKRCIFISGRMLRQTHLRQDAASIHPEMKPSSSGRCPRQ